MTLKFNPLIPSNLDDIGSASASGDVVGPGSATDNAVARYDGTTGKLIQNSSASIDDSGNISANNLSGTNTGDQTITLTSDVTGSGTGSFATTIANDAVTLAKMANMATSSLIYRKTAGTGDPEVNTLATVKTDLGLTGTNSGDVTLAGTPDYITLSGQVITRNKLDLIDDVNTFSSANLASLLTNENGTGSVVFDTSPILGGTPGITPVAPINNPPYAMISAGPTTNLVPNPSFEVNVTDGWNNQGTVTRSRDTTDKFVGDASMKIVTSGVTNSGTISSAIAVSGSKDYVMSFYAKGNVGGEQIVAAVIGNVSGASNTVLVSAPDFYLREVLTTSWKRYRWFIRTTTDTSVTIRIMQNSAITQTWFIDGVQLEEYLYPTYNTDSMFPSPYCDGSLGTGHSWSGTAHNSSSSRTAGTKWLAPLSSSSAGYLAQHTDGTLTGHFVFDAKEAVFGSANNNGIWYDEPYFPFQVKGDFQTNTVTSGASQGVARVVNAGNGTALYVQSAATNGTGMVLDFGSLTSGTGLVVYAPSDLTTMISNGGYFFSFADKSGAYSYAFSPVYSQFGTPGLPYQNRYTFFGGGGMTATNTANRTGTVAVTTANATCTGTGTTFLTDYRRGDNIQVEQTASTWTSYQVASVTSDTVLTMTSNGTAIVTGKNHRSKTRQYYPANLQLAGAYGDYAGSHVGDYLYNVFPNGSNGQLHVMKSSAVGSTTPPTENAGDAIVTRRLADTTTRSISASAAETTVITGYTSPNLELYAGKNFRIKFWGNMDTVLSTSTVTWRVKIGGTTILTSTARQSGSLNNIDFVGEIGIVGTSTSAQKSSISVVGSDTTITTGVNVYNEQRIGTSSVDMRYADQAITVTAQFSDASTMNIQNAYLEII